MVGSTHYNFYLESFVNFLVSLIFFKLWSFAHKTDIWPHCGRRLSTHAHYWCAAMTKDGSETECDAVGRTYREFCFPSHLIAFGLTSVVR